jgi:hypothetical protein
VLADDPILTGLIIFVDQSKFKTLGIDFNIFSIPSIVEVSLPVLRVSIIQFYNWTALNRTDRFPSLAISNPTVLPYIKCTFCTGLISIKN